MTQEVQLLPPFDTFAERLQGLETAVMALQESQDELAQSIVSLWKSVIELEALRNLIEGLD